MCLKGSDVELLINSVLAKTNIPETPTIGFKADTGHSYYGVSSITSWAPLPLKIRQARREERGLVIPSERRVTHS